MLVYKYGLLPPVVNADLVYQQMRSVHDYRNARIQIERGKRDALRSAMVDIGTAIGIDLSALESAARDAGRAVAKIEEKMNASRIETRSKVNTKADRARMRAAKDDLGKAYKALYEARKTIRCHGGDGGPYWLAQYEIEELAKKLIKSANAYSPAYWGSRQLVDMAAGASENSLALYDGIDSCDPKFLRWYGEGALGVQIQKSKPMSTSAVFGNDTRLRIELDGLHPQPKRAPDWTRENQHMVERRGPMLHMRIGSDGRNPVWSSWPMIMHRPLAEGQIKRVTVHLRMIGPRPEWSVDIYVDEAGSRCNEDRASIGVVAIDIGWRKIGDELRVASWAGSDGASGELRLSQKVISHLTKWRSLASIREKSFNETRKVLTEWLRGVNTPEWFRNATAHMHAWKQINRLVSLARRWKNARFDGDSEGYDALEKWRYHDHHLWRWQEDSRISGLRMRREVYRVFAADLARRYAKVGLEDFDLTSVAKRPSVEDDPVNETAASNRQMASLSEFRLCVTNAFGAANAVKVDAAWTTKTCHACGKREKWTHPDELQHTCKHCGAVWDRDENAAQNILARTCERLRADESTGPARGDGISNDTAEVKESRWAKAGRNSKKRKEIYEAARKANGNIAETVEE